MLTYVEMRKRYVIYIRAILSLAICLVAIYNLSLGIRNFAAGIVFLILLVASNFVFMALPARLFKGIKLHYLVFVLDMFFIIVGAHIFTNLELQFILAVFLTIFMAALSQSVGLSMLIAVVVNSVYIYIMYITGGEVLNEVSLLNLPFIFVVALHSSYLAEKSNEETKEKMQLEKINVLLTRKITSKSRELSEVSGFTECLCDSFRKAVIILDTEGNVRFFNSRAEKIFGISREVAVNRPVSELTALGSLKEAFMEVKFGSGDFESKEMAVRPGMSMKVTAGFIRDKAGSEIGILCYSEEAGR
ncbi:MAG TPA: PAS domain-containing protein [Candidatus Goldiibacteriota bacterium]|nr:PAS domain-containing protein [Candidatus Goldiibacteriota bacterium]